MTMPPAHIAPADLFAQITAIPRPNRLVPFPKVNPATGEPFEIAMWILSQHETMQVAAEAEKTTRKLLKDNVPNKDEQAKGYNDLYNNASAMELLYRACRMPDDLSKPLFPSKHMIGEMLTTDEIAILLNHYFTLQVELGAVVGAMDEEEMEAWITKLIAGGQSSQYFLNSFSWEAVKTLVIFMANRLPKSVMESSSSTLPQEEPPSEPEQKPKLESKPNKHNKTKL